MSRGGIAVVVSGFPRRSETFALGELLALQSRGLLAALFATKAGEEGALQPGVEPLLERVQWLPTGTPEEQATVVAERAARLDVAGVHGYFAHAPASVAERAAARLGVRFGFSAHAKDARKVPPRELAERARRAACVVACNADVATELLGAGAPLHLVPHGVDLGRFRAEPLPPAPPLRLLAVGRLVEKKGFLTLLHAAARLTVPFHLRVVGDGPERPTLESAVSALGLERSVTLCGDRTHAELPGEYAAAHAVVVPSVVDAQGDRDGLPNVVLEAMASGRAVVATRVGAIPSGVADEVTGLLVAPNDPAALAAALGRLAADGALTEALGRRGWARAAREFDVARCAARFCDVLEAAYA